ncbi:MAG: hypothetical protein N838_12560 [Thiohalocapsa sp. PB-PSB1]|nr:MAG: hypothetical protein N838_12560 [Thiohalocapsa sp. PB-PSB1]
MHRAITAEKQTDWRRILVREAAICPQSLYGRIAATSVLDEETSQAAGFSTEIAEAQ